MIFRPTTTPAQHRAAAEAARALTAHAIAEAVRRIQARQKERTQIDTEAMEVPTDAK
jgi:hypothetical protein